MGVAYFTHHTPNMEILQRPYIDLDRDRTWFENFKVWIRLLRSTAGPLLHTVATSAASWFWWSIALIGLGSLAVAPDLMLRFEMAQSPYAQNGEPGPIDPTVAVGLLLVCTTLLVIHLRVASICHGFYRAYHEVRTVPEVTLTAELVGEVSRGFVRAIAIGIGVVLMILLSKAIVIGVVSFLEVFLTFLSRVVVVVVLVASLGVGHVLPALIANENPPVAGLLSRLAGILRGRWWSSIGMGTMLVVILVAVCFCTIPVLTFVVNILDRFLGAVTDEYTVFGRVVVGITGFASLLCLTVPLVVIHQSFGVVAYFGMRTHADGNGRRTAVDTVAVSGNDGMAEGRPNA